MAYKGFAYCVFAPIEGEADGLPVYGAGAAIGRALKYELDPEYEDTSEYSDMNDLDPAQEFVRAKLTLETAEVSDPALLMLGDAWADDGHVSVDISRAVPCGVGLVRPATMHGETRWAVTWLYKVMIRSVKDKAESRDKAIAYSTPEIEALAIPAAGGIWRRNNYFDTKDDAVTYVNSVAGI